MALIAVPIHDAQLDEQPLAYEPSLGGRPLSAVDFERIYDQRWKGVKRQAGRRLNTHASTMAEDIAQEVFLSLWKSPKVRLYDHDYGLTALILRVR